MSAGDVSLLPDKCNMQGFLLLPPIRAHAKQQAIERTRKKKRKGSSMHLNILPPVIDILTGAHAP